MTKYDTKESQLELLFEPFAYAEDSTSNITNTQRITTRTHLAILSLACGSFALGINEFIPLSFLSEISDEYSISVSKASWIVTVFMLGCTVSAPVIMTIAVKYEYKYLLITLQSVLIVSSAICMLSPNFLILLMGRVMSSFSHATYLGLGSSTVESLVPKEMQGYANSLFFAGLSLSNVIGVPAATFLGTETKWNYAFIPVIGCALLSTIGMIFFLPKINNQSQINFKKELIIFKKNEVWLASLTILFGYAGMLASHTYFAEMMTNLAGFSDNDIFWLAILYGIGAVIGNFYGGEIADINISRAVMTQLCMLACVLFAFTVTVNYKIPAAITLFANGFSGFSLIAPLMGYMNNKATDGKNLAKILNISSFGLGIALGVFLASLAIQNGYGYRSPNWIGGSLTILGLIFFLLGEHIKKTNINTVYLPLTELPYSSSPYKLFSASKSLTQEAKKNYGATNDSCAPDRGSFGGSEGTGFPNTPLQPFASLGCSQ